MTVSLTSQIISEATSRRRPSAGLCFNKAALQCRSYDTPQDLVQALRSGAVADDGGDRADPGFTPRGSCGLISCQRTSCYLLVRYRTTFL
jgi:hypothetical protein